ncbi:hypothetical protein BKH41_08810 [Helicobacter sp. 12S02232-10]|uniref:hypothetical protein n=1 Tax=Helicobacter sp. 12S02232-10 TaxID=1476197 RepID=UPI000BA66C98|nr:hypothetical protein [Helicobacter sp. 12S02232-10]PAF46595.1 hypothetical protein BKH41_08810 [Helicobacter sp. 12S02232-10]
MKKIVLWMIVFVSVLNAFICSSSIEDGGPSQLEIIETQAEAQLDIVDASWELIKKISETIKNQSEQKQQYLQNIENLTKENAIKEQKIEFEFERYQKLLGVSNDTQSSISK